MPNHDPQAPAIELAHLTFAYEGSAPQLEDVNLTVQPGEVVVLTGPSGGGKSTLTRVVNGLVPSFYEGELTGRCACSGARSTTSLRGNAGSRRATCSKTPAASSSRTRWRARSRSGARTTGSITS